MAFRRPEAKVSPAGDAVRYGQPELTPGWLQGGAQSAFEKRGLPEIGQIHGCAPARNRLRTRSGAILPLWPVASHCVHERTKVIYQADCAPSEAIDRSFGAEGLLTEEAENGQHSEESSKDRHGPPAGSGQPEAGEGPRVQPGR